MIFGLYRDIRILLNLCVYLVFKGSWFYQLSRYIHYITDEHLSKCHCVYPLVSDDHI